MKVVTAAVNQGIITSDTSELPGSFGMVGATTITEGGREIRIRMERDTKGDLLIREIGAQIAEGAEGVVSRAKQLNEEQAPEVIKEPKTQTVLEDEEVSAPDIRREATLMAKAKGGVEQGIMVRHVMGGGDVGFMAHRSGGDMTRAAAARKAAVLLLQTPPDQVGLYRETSWKIPEERKSELAQALATMAT